MTNKDLVFIIDDDTMQNEIHTLLISKYFPEKEVRTFNCSVDALKEIDKGHKPGVIFLDVHLPCEEDGLFLTEYDKRNLTCSIYLMSSMAYLKDESMLKKHPQIKEFITKPLLEHKLKQVFSNI